MDEDPPRKRRETYLTVFLALLLLGAFVFLLTLLSFGFFFYVVVAVGGIVLLGYVHYVFWGYALSQQTAGEREEEEVRRRMEGEDR